MAAKLDLKGESVVVVIGSGASGGTLANELARQGVRVVLLEAGPRYELSDFENHEWGMFGKTPGWTSAPPPGTGGSSGTSPAGAPGCAGARAAARAGSRRAPGRLRSGGWR